MKKLLLITALLIGYLGQAQNQEIINKMIESKTIEDIKMVAHDIVTKSNSKYDFYKVLKYTRKDTKESYQYVISTKAGMTDREKSELSSNRYANCLIVKFNESDTNGLVYNFKEVSGDYLDLADFWTATFYPTASKELVIDDFKLKEYRVSKDLKYKLVKNESSYSILRSY